MCVCVCARARARARGRARADGDGRFQWLLFCEHIERARKSTWGQANRVKNAKVFSDIDADGSGRLSRACRQGSVERAPSQTRRARPRRCRPTQSGGRSGARRCWRAAVDAVNDDIAQYYDDRLTYLCWRFRNYHYITAQDLHDCFRPEAEIEYHSDHKCSEAWYNFTACLTC